MTCKNSGNGGEYRDRDRTVLHVGVESLSMIQSVRKVKEARSSFGDGFDSQA